MIAFLQGKLVYQGLDYLVINVNGVGYKVFVPTTAFSAIHKEMEEVRLFTHLHVREDAMVLYGFVEREELELFETLINVNGVGPKVALGILSAGAAISIKQAIVGENLAVLTNIPGIGKKTAQRIVIELKDKLAKEPLTLAGSELPGAAVSAPGPAGHEAVEALQALGYSQSEGARAVQAVITREGSELRVEDVIRLALKELARF